MTLTERREEVLREAHRQRVRGRHLKILHYYHWPSKCWTKVGNIIHVSVNMGKTNVSGRRLTYCLFASETSLYSFSIIWPFFKSQSIQKYNIYCSKKLKEHLKKNQIMNIYTNMDSVICYGWWRCHVVWRNWKLSAYTQGRFIAGPKIDLGQVSMGGINPSIVHDLFAHPCHMKQGITVHQGEPNTHCTSSGSDKVFKDPNY